jgi:hypothetical protein
MSKTAGIEFIRNEMDWDKYDPWASVMSALFDMCEAWWLHTGEKIDGYEPAGVQPYSCESERVARLVGAFKHGVATEADMLHWLDVLNRMYGLVIQSGRSY